MSEDITRDVLCEELKKAIINGDSERAENVVVKLLDKYDAYEIVKHCMMEAMRIVGDKFAKLEIFLPEVLLSAEAFEKCMKHIEPKILERKKELIVGRVVIGTIQGDIHSLGKNIVATMLRATGFEVYDLGTDVPVMKFIEKAKEVNANIIAISALLSTSLPYIKDVIRTLEELGLRDKFKVMVGGGAVTREWARSIEADGYGEDAEEAVRVALELVGKG